MAILIQLNLVLKEYHKENKKVDFFFFANSISLSKNANLDTTKKTIFSFK